MIKKIMLEPGDILFYRVNKKSYWFSQLVAWGQRLFCGGDVKGQSYSHVAIVDSDTNYILESRWPKAQRTWIDEKTLNKKYDMEVYRVTDLTEEQLQKILHWARTHLDERYDIWYFLFGWFDAKNQEVCSTFVHKAFYSAEIFLTTTQNMITPDKLRNLSLLTRVS